MKRKCNVFIQGSESILYERTRAVFRDSAFLWITARQAPATCGGFLGGLLARVRPKVAQQFPPGKQGCTQSRFSKQKTSSTTEAELCNCEITSSELQTYLLCCQYISNTVIICVIYMLYRKILCAGIYLFILLWEVLFLFYCSSHEFVILCSEGLRRVFKYKEH